jgi:transcriptional regulator with XRE-family HTH domain
MAQRRVTSPGFRDVRYKEVIELLKLRRQELGLSQQALAERLGLHKQFISRVELGERRLDFVEFSDLVRALELAPSQLMAEIPAA